MPLARSGSRGHHIRYLGFGGVYEISWRLEVKHGRLLGYKTFRRDTDKAGAERFAKKWGCQMPPEPTSTK